MWTWNAIGKRAGAWGLAPDAPEATRGFLLNHLIAELLPEQPGGYRFSNCDPVTGQAAWYDLQGARGEGRQVREARDVAALRGAAPTPPGVVSSSAALDVRCRPSREREGD